MKTPKYYLATAGLLCSAVSGLAVPLANTFASSVTPEETAVIDVTDGIKAVIQPIINNA